MSKTSRCLRLFLTASFILVAMALAAVSSASAHQERRVTVAHTARTCTRAGLAPRARVSNRAHDRAGKPSARRRAHAQLVGHGTRPHLLRTHRRTLAVRGTRFDPCIIRTPATSSPKQPAPVPPVSSPVPPVSSPVPPVSHPVPPVSGPGTGGGDAPFFDGTFSSPSEWPSVYGSCNQTLNNTEVQFAITSACDPAGDGHYRTDLCSASGCHGNGSIADGDVYQAGQATCTSVPIDIQNVSPIPGDSWMMFAEEKDSSASNAAWAFMLNSYYTGANQFQISFVRGTNNTTWDGTATPGWHTLSICTNNANNASGEVYGIYEDGARLTFNHGTDSGSQSITNYPIINNGMSSWPLDIDDYTGGSVADDTITTGAPLVSSGSTNPPMPSNGWNNA